jgi:hypothetical protein
MSHAVLTTELEAINTMLDAAGESPVSTLETSGLADVAECKLVLDQVLRSALEVGWTFNKEEDWDIVPDVDGFINLPVNCLSFDVERNSSKSNSADTIQRGLRLYDKKNHTYVFTETITGEIVILLHWEELPQAARSYIMIKAARIYQTRALGSDTLHKFSEQQELNAYAALRRAQAKKTDGSFFKDSWSVSSVLYR